jgi:hypothetical protein
LIEYVCCKKKELTYYDERDKSALSAGAAVKKITCEKNEKESRRETQKSNVKAKKKFHANFFEKKINICVYVNVFFMKVVNFRFPKKKMKTFILQQKKKCESCNYKGTMGNGKK